MIVEHLDSLHPETVRPIPHPDALENLKFSQCLPPEIAAEVFVARFDDHTAVVQALAEKRRIVQAEQS